MHENGHGVNTIVQSETGDPLRVTFVEMLFALATAQVAINTAALVEIATDVEHKLPAGAHLFMALLLIACSWVGWRKSSSPGMQEKIANVFTPSFVGLLLDVFLVILYFILVQNGEVNVGPPVSLGAASAKPEALVLLWVFGIYIFWDVIVDVFSPGCAPNSPMVLVLFKGIFAAIVSALASFLCFVLVALVWWFAGKTSSSHQVIALDIALCATILLFRAAKGLENPFSRWLRVTDWRAFRNPREVSLTVKIWGWICFVVYLTAIVVCYFIRE